MATLATVVNPTRRLGDYLATHAANRLTKSIVAVTTPQYATQLPSLHEEFPNVQLVALAADTVPLGTQRDGFSWMVLEQALKITSTPLQRSNSRGWQPTTSAFRMTSGKHMDIAIPTANTLFETGQEATMYSSESSGPLESVHIDVSLPMRVHNAIRPLAQLSPKLTVTAATDNMLKTLDGIAAASYLEKAHELATNKDRDVYAELDDGRFIKVVAGGGGLWSPKASMLVLEPPCTLRVGQHLTFHLATNTLDHTLESQLQSAQDKVVFEIASQPDSLAEQRPFLTYSKRNHFLPVFGFGSERGFLLGDDKHSIVGESLQFGM